MPDKTVAQKLLIKEDYKVLFINEPDNYADLIQLFVTYPKGTSRIETDINRDIIREYAII